MTELRVGDQIQPLPWNERHSTGFNVSQSCVLHSHRHVPNTIDCGRALFVPILLEPINVVSVPTPTGGGRVPGFVRICRIGFSK